MNKTKILIVEDEILIADLIERYLSQVGYTVVGIAISYEAAEKLYRQKQPDMTLIDIRLNGSKTGIDLAHFIRQQPRSRPFIYLTSQLDRRSINLAKKTFPAGYLSKPIQAGSLYSSIEIALHTHQTKIVNEAVITVSNGMIHQILPVQDILYLKVDHIYLQFYTKSYGMLIQRRALTEIMGELPGPPFMKVHRSFAVNLQEVNAWDQQQVFIDGEAIPVSRSRRKEIYNYLEQQDQSTFSAHT